MINVKITFVNAILKINQLNISSVFEIFEKQVVELLSEGELIFSEHLYIGSPHPPLVNEALLFHNTCQNPLSVWDLGNKSGLLKP